VSDPQDPREPGPPPPPAGSQPPPADRYPPPAQSYPPPPAPGGPQDVHGQPPPPSHGYAPPSGAPGGWAAGTPGPGTGGGLQGAVLPLRPLTVGDVLDGAFRLLRARFGRVALLVILVLGPYQLATAFLVERFVPELGPTGDPQVFFDGTMSDELAARFFGVAAGMGLLGMLAYLVVAGALVWTVLRADMRRPAEVGEAVLAGVRRLWATGASSVLLALLGLTGLAAVVFASVLLGMAVLPLGFLVGIPLSVLFSLAWFAAAILVVPIAMVETDAGAGRVTARAISLVRRRFWRFVGVGVLVLLMLSLVTFAINLVLGVAAMAAGPAAWVVDAVSGTLVSVITAPVLVFAALLLYLDARVRLEGWDLQLRAQRSTPPW
jgi:hypothetical protein